MYTSTQTNEKKMFCIGVDKSIPLWYNKEKRKEIITMDTMILLQLALGLTTLAIAEILEILEKD